MSAILLVVLFIAAAMLWTGFSMIRGLFRGVRRAAGRRVARELVTGRDGSGRRVTMGERARRWWMRRRFFRSDDMVEPRHGLRAASITAGLFVVTSCAGWGLWPWELPLIAGRMAGTTVRWTLGAYLAAGFMAQVLIGLFVVLWLSSRRRTRLERLGGEADTVEGRVRAAENRVIRQALELVWEDLGIQHEPRCGKVVRAKSKISGTAQEYGWTVALNLTGSFTFDHLSAKGEQIAQALNALLRTMSGTDIDLIRRHRKGGVPQFVDVIPARRTRRDGRQVQGEVTLTLASVDPFNTVVRAPWVKARPVLRSRKWGDHFRVGVWRDGSQASCAPVQTMIQGATGCGKGTLGYSVAAEAAQMEHVAIIGIDLKGGADLSPLLPRLSGLATTPDQAERVWQAAAADLDARRKAGAVAETPSAQWPAVLILMAESQFYALGCDTKTTDRRWAPVSEITTQGRAKNMIALLDTQYGTATGIPSSVSGPVDQLLSGRVTKTHQSGVTAGAAASKHHGPHKIKRSQKGVFFGEFSGEIDRADFIRTYYYGEPEAARAWAARWAQHTAELRVELPWLTKALGGPTVDVELADAEPAPVPAWRQAVEADLEALEQFANAHGLGGCPKGTAKATVRRWVAGVVHEALNEDGPNRDAWEERKARVVAALTA